MGAAKLASLSNETIEDNLMQNISNGVHETLQQMGNVQCVFEKSFSDMNWMPPQGYSVFLKISSPPSQAQIRFHFSHAAVGKVYNSIMNENIIPNRAQALDCLGEISNISYGLAKQKSNEEGFNLSMALPHTHDSNDLPKLISKNPKTIIPFMIFNETCYIEVVILN